MVTKFPDVPFNVKLLNVVFDDAVKSTVVGCTVFVIFWKVLFPEIVIAPAPPCISVGYDPPPPANVFVEEDDIFIDPVPDVVKLVEVVTSHAVPVAVTSIDPDAPKRSERVFELFELK